MIKSEREIKTFNCSVLRISADLEVKLVVLELVRIKFVKSRLGLSFFAFDRNQSKLNSNMNGNYIPIVCEVSH